MIGVLLWYRFRSRGLGTGVLGAHSPKGLGTRDNLGLEELPLGFEEPGFARQNVLWEGIGLDLFEELGELAVSVELPGGRRGEGQGGLGPGL